MLKMVPSLKYFDDGGANTPMNSWSVRATSSNGQMHIYGGCAPGSELLTKNLYTCNLASMAFKNLTVR